MLAFFVTNAYWSIGDLSHDPANSHSAVKVCDYVFKALKTVLIDIYMSYTFLEQFRYFLNRKRDVLRERG